MNEESDPTVEIPPIVPIATDVQTSEGFALQDPAQTTPVEPPPASGVRPVVIQVPTRHNPVLQQVIDRVNADADLYATWRCANINAVDRLGMSDHGPVHVQIVANIGLRLLRLLIARDIVPSIVHDHKMTIQDAEVVVVLACLLHDVGMSIQRADHEQFSLFLANDKLKDLLVGIYEPAARRVMISETLHAIISHRAGGDPITVEAGIVRLADALDMAKGRSRIPFAAGQVNIHSVSAAAIDKVDIVPGDTTPIRISIAMNNSAGIFQLDALLKEKLRGSGLERYVEVEAHIASEHEKRLVETFRV